MRRRRIRRQVSLALSVKGTATKHTLSEKIFASLNLIAVFEIVGTDLEEQLQRPYTMIRWQWPGCRNRRGYIADIFGLKVMTSKKSLFVYGALT